MADLHELLKEMIDKNNALFCTQHQDKMSVFLRFNDIKDFQKKT